MAVSDALKALVAQMPDPDERGMFTENIDKDKIEKAVALIQEGGKESILGLVEMLGEPGTAQDVKPHYALHCVVNRALILKDENARRLICETLAAQLDGDLPQHNKAFLCQELQWGGRQESVAALGKLLLDEELVEPASMALSAIGQDAAEPLRKALPQAAGKCRLNILQGLAAIQDPQSKAAFAAALGDADREVRIVAGWGLARTGDANSVDPLLKAAAGELGWERIQATKHCLMLAEKLAAGGDAEAAKRIYTQLRDTRTDLSELYVREAAEKALAAL